MPAAPSVGGSIERPMLVRHVMTPDPFTVGPDDLCSDVLREMRARGFRHAPVVEGGALVGVVSERDLVRALPHLIESLERDADGASALATVRSTMTAKALTCSASDPLDQVARRMLDARVGCLVVVDDSGAAGGIVTTADALRGFTGHLDLMGASPLTLLWTRGGVESVPDVARLASAAGAVIVAHFFTETAPGAIAIMAHVRGGADAMAGFQDLCQDAGLLLMRRPAAA